MHARALLLPPGILYTLSRLASSKPGVIQALKQRSAVQVVLRLLQVVSDQDVMLGALQLLEVLGASGLGGRGPGPGPSPHKADKPAAAGCLQGASNYGGSGMGNARMGYQQHLADRAGNATACS